MRTWELEVRRPWDDHAIAQTIECAATSQLLVISMRGTLKAYPGCIHWHFKKERKSGTIEATMWPAEQRVWLSVQSRRSADWTDDAVMYLFKELSMTLGTAPQGR